MLKAWLWANSNPPTQNGTEQGWELKSNHPSILPVPVSEHLCMLQAKAYRRPLRGLNTNTQLNNKTAQFSIVESWDQSTSYNSILLLLNVLVIEY